MSTTVTRMDQDTKTLYVAFELGEKEWKLAMSRETPPIQIRTGLAALGVAGAESEDCRARQGECVPLTSA